MLSDTEVGKIVDGVAKKKGWNVFVAAHRPQTSDTNLVIRVSGGVHKSFEFVMDTDATADDVRAKAEQIFGVQP